MIKRIIAGVLCLLMLTALLPLTAMAKETEEEQTEEVSEEEEICQRITDFYWKIMRVCPGYTLEGWCGLMAGWELYYLGVTSKPLTWNGNDQYDNYAYMKQTDTGHAIHKYPTKEYTMEEALNTITRCGTMNAYNIMAGFQKTRTVAGQKYGHVTVIHGVLDGVVYYTEGFDTKYGLRPEEAHICTIEEWADLYETWTTFEGIVDFGTKAYADFCDYYPASLFVTAKDPITILSDPGSEAAQPLRTAAKGERLYAIGVYQNTEGQLYYQLNDSDTICYVAASDVEPLLFDYSDVTADALTMPERLEVGADFELAGNLYSINNRYKNIRLEVRNDKDEVVLEYDFAKNSCFFDLGRKTVNQKVKFSTLPEGSYTYYVYGDVKNHYVAENEIRFEEKRITLAAQPFAVGAAEIADTTPAQQTLAEVPADGWSYADGCWRCYHNGEIRTGWFCENGLDYYLLEDGTAATGWQEINGKDRFFSSTGVMRTGWLNTRQGKMYMLFNGAPAIGWRTIDGNLYFFNEDGLMQTDCTVEQNGTTYYLQPDGIAVLPEAPAVE